MTSPASSRIDVSFEVFPAGNDMAAAKLRNCVDTLSGLRPRFVSVTYGANGSERARTARSIDTLKSRHAGLGLAGHLTCVGGTQTEVMDIAKGYERSGATWAVALRGDGDAGAGGDFTAQADGFASSPDLIAALREQTNLRIAVAGYPEPHPDSQGWQADMDHLKRKVDAGADAIITQFFFENENFYRFVERCRKSGIDAAIIPGIMPIRNFDKMAGFAAKCGAYIPPRLADRFAKAKECQAEHELALAVCAGQCDDLREEGVKSFHFYTLNDAALTLGTCRALGLDPANPVDGDGIHAEESEMMAAIRA